MQAEAIAEAARENARKTRDVAFAGALKVIEDTISKAAAFQARMGSIEGSAMRDSDLHIEAQPAMFTGGTLRDYQLTGYRWLVRRSFCGESVIIADEMGMGKTIQVLAYLAWCRTYLPGPVLIIGPLSTLGNWVDEIRRFTPSIPVVRYHGNAAERQELRDEFLPALEAFNSATSAAARAAAAAKTAAASGGSAGGAGSASKKGRRTSDAGAAAAAHEAAAARAAALAATVPIVATSFEMAMRDEEALSSVHWRTLVIDEGHKLKNEASVVRSILKRYAPVSAAAATAAGGPQTKILLTGTPVQNDLVELWSLCNFIMPLVFNSKEEFKKIYTFMGMGTAAGSDYLRSQEQQHAIISKLHALLERYMLRRTKAEVHLNLPPKVETLVYTPLTREQVRLLRAIQAGRVNEELAAMGWVSREDPGKLAAISGHNKSMNLRKVCVHPYFFAEPPVPTSVRTGDNATDSRIVSSCGKMVVLDKMLRQLRKDGHRVLIFSQFKTVIEILQDYFAWAGTGAVGECRVITGDTPALDRDHAIREFNADKDGKIFAFLLSTKAGGLGINLASADTVIFYDSDWNPKNDEQAQDRAHRIGQVRPVVVYRLVTEGASVERRMLRVAAGKSSLGRVVLQEGRYLLGDARYTGQQSISPTAAALATASAAGKKGKKRGFEALDAVDAATGTTTGVEDVEDAEDAAAVDPETGLSRYGKCSDRLLQYWLRQDVGDDSAIMRGISNEELTMVLHRARALQAGKRVADAVEATLLGDADAAARAAAAAAGAAHDKQHHHVQHGLGTPSSTVSLHTPAKGVADVNASPSAASSSSRKRRLSPAPSPAAAPVTPAVADNTGGTAASSNPSVVLSPSRAALPPKAAASMSAGSKAAVEEEIGAWLAAAAAAPFTPSKGDGYEFVYHQASRGILGLSALPTGVAAVANSGSATSVDAESGGGSGGAASASTGDPSASSASADSTASPARKKARI